MTKPGDGKSIKAATVKSVDDFGRLRLARVAYLGREQLALCMTPYGLIHNPPPGSLAIVLNQQGHESNGMAICDHPEIRPLKGLAPGEVGLCNYLTGSYVVMRENGDIEVECKSNLLATVAGDANLDAGGNISASAGGNLDVGAVGDVTVQAGGSLTAVSTAPASVTAPAITLNGPVTINGPLTSSPGAGMPSLSMDESGLKISNGDIKAEGGDVQADSISLKTHVHTAPSGGGPTSAPL